MPQLLGTNVLLCPVPPISGSGDTGIGQTGRVRHHGGERQPLQRSGHPTPFARVFPSLPALDHGLLWQAIQGLLQLPGAQDSRKSSSSGIPCESLLLDTGDASRSCFYTPRPSVSRGTCTHCVHCLAPSVWSDPSTSVISGSRAAVSVRSASSNVPDTETWST